MNAEESKLRQAEQKYLAMSNRPDYKFHQREPNEPFPLADNTFKELWVALQEWKKSTA